MGAGAGLSSRVGAFGAGAAPWERPAGVALAAKLRGGRRLESQPREGAVGDFSYFCPMRQIA